MNSNKLFWIILLAAATCVLLGLALRSGENSSAYFVAAALAFMGCVRTFRTWRQQIATSKIASIKMVEGAEELKQALQSDSAILYKHSTACTISRTTMTQIQAFARSHPSVPIFLIDVIRHRDLSNKVAKELKIPHESPQAIILRKRKPVWDASHYAITTEALSNEFA